MRANLAGPLEMGGVGLDELVRRDVLHSFRSRHGSNGKLSRGFRAREEQDEDDSLGFLIFAVGFIYRSRLGWVARPIKLLGLPAYLFFQSSSISSH